jgi:hypothetical protein
MPPWLLEEGGSRFAPRGQNTSELELLPSATAEDAQHHPAFSPPWPARRGGTSTHLTASLSSSLPRPSRRRVAERHHHRAPEAPTAALFEEASVPPAGATPTSRETRRGGTPRAVNLANKIQRASFELRGNCPNPKLLTAPHLHHLWPPWPLERLGIGPANRRAS